MRDRELELFFSTGELTVHPKCQEILSLLDGYNTLLFTNAGMYNEGIAGLMSRGQMAIVTSLDCGTPEAFKKIKAVDMFSEVCGNLTRYAASGGCIILKYIMLPDINDNAADIEGFLSLAWKIGAVVQISNDSRTKCADMPPETLSAALRLVAGARKTNLLVIHESEVFSCADNKSIVEALRVNERMSM